MDDPRKDYPDPKRPSKQLQIHNLPTEWEYTNSTNQGDLLFFLRDKPPPLLLVLAMVLLNHLLGKWNDRYKLQKSQEKFNRLMYTYDIKQFAKNEKELETLTQAVRNGIWLGKRYRARNEKRKTVNNWTSRNTKEKKK